MTTESERRSNAVLIVEDDPHMRALLVGMARQFGFLHMVEAPSLNTALEHLAKGVFDVALVDLSLAPGDGVDLIRLMRSHIRDHVRGMPVVVVSRTATESRIREAIVAGADGFIAKPVTSAGFHRQVSLSCVKRALAAETARRIAPRKAAAGGSADIFELE